MLPKKEIQTKCSLRHESKTNAPLLLLTVKKIKK